MRRLLLLLSLTLVLLAARPSAAERPSGAARIRAEIAAMSSSIAACGGAEVAFVATASSVNFIRGHAWILSLSVVDAPAYGGRYFVLSELDGRLTGELLQGHGPDGTRALSGEDLSRFLARVDLDDGPIRAAFARYYREAGPPGRAPR